MLSPASNGWQAKASTRLLVKGLHLTLDYMAKTREICRLIITGIHTTKPEAICPGLLITNFLKVLILKNLNSLRVAL